MLLCSRLSLSLKQERLKHIQFYHIRDYSLIYQETFPILPPKVVYDVGFHEHCWSGSCNLAWTQLRSRKSQPKEKPIKNYYLCCFDRVFLRVVKNLIVVYGRIVILKTPGSSGKYWPEKPRLTFIK